MTKGYQFGTFKGVFTPSILTILGVVMYLRMGWVLGNAGLFGTLIIITCSSAITFLTGLSLAALATNMRVRGGGAYYIISRSLGLEAGAAIGLPLYMAQALGISFYIAGFSESLVETVPSLNPVVIGLVTLCLLTGLAYYSAALALKSQFIIMLAIVLSLVSFFLGGEPDASAAAILPSTVASPVVPFWGIFAVFFPAVTGIEAGIAMSGDLKDPAKSLPIGTIAAIVIGYIVYLAIPIFLSYTVANTDLLISDPLIMQKVARWGQIVVVGIWAASLSSALGALLGAPRTLQALANDGIVPRFIGRAFGKGNDPRIATCISFAIGLCGILLGDLNLIAPILSMFFLTSYGALNLSAGVEELVSTPAWRPKFRVPAIFGLAGFLACIGAMLMIDPGAAIIAVAITSSIYYVMKRRSLTARWGDMRYGLMMYAVRHLLYRLASGSDYEKNWQPNILVLSGAPTTRWYLVELADALARNKHFLTVASVISPNVSTDRVKKLSTSIREYLKAREVQAFVKIFRAPRPLIGIRELIKAYGFGPLAPNTIMIGETEEVENYLDFAELMQSIFNMHRNLVIVRESGITTAHSEDEDLRIDVWTKGDSKNTGFIIALASLLQRGQAWRGAHIRVKRIIDASETHPEVIAKEMNDHFKNERIRATAEVIAGNGTPFLEVISESSKDANLVIMGMRPPLENEEISSYAEYYGNVIRQTEDLPATALVIAGQDIDLKRLFAHD